MVLQGLGLKFEDFKILISLNEDDKILTIMSKQKINIYQTKLNTQEVNVYFNNICSDGYYLFKPSVLYCFIISRLNFT